MQVDRCGLQVILDERVDDDATACELLLDRTVTQNHRLAPPLKPGPTAVFAIAQTLQPHRG